MGHGEQHIGRSWPGQRPVMEEQCPCPKAACGLVVASTIAPGCDQHGMSGAKTIRQNHYESDCPMLAKPDEIAGVACQHCKHPWSAHSTEVGCTSGWAYNEEGVAITDGCYCPLANTQVGA